MSNSRRAEPRMRWRWTVICASIAALPFVHLGRSVDLLHRLPSPGLARLTAQEARAPLRNDLAGSISPYLRAAADQPVHWQEWSDEVFALASTLDRPIYLDIGAIWCHWCHVMDRESYENPEIAAIINDLFIPIKVDRDLRPDIDQRYQRAVAEVAGGGGGWPLTAFLTPDGEVFYGGTYFPPETLEKVLTQVAQGYRKDRDRVTTTTQALRRHLSSVLAGKPSMVSVEIIDAVTKSAREQFDGAWGGFSQAPKFPNSNVVTLLINRYVQTEDKKLLEMITTTLDKMAAGGMRDQLSGAFHRYVTDRQWRVPHFEVMLYTNAEILSNYLDAYALTGNDHYREAAEGIIGFMQSALASAGGGFFASQDADVSLDDDGSHYTWSIEQLEAAVSADEAEILKRYYDIGPRGEMSSVPKTKDSTQNVLWVAATPEQIARDLRKPIAEATQLVESGRRKMIEARRRRPTPHIDRTIFTDWNGLMVSSYLKAYEILGHEGARDFALETLDFLLQHCVDSTAGVYHSCSEDERHMPGLLDDQVMIVRALLDAYEVTGEPDYVTRARQIIRWTVEHLWDGMGGGFFDTRPDRNAVGLLDVLQKEVEDTPFAASGNAVAAQVLNRLHYLTQDEGYRDYARRTIETFAARAREDGTMVAALGIATEEYLEYPTTVIVIGSGGDPGAESLHQAALGAFRPGKIVMRVEPNRVNREQLPAAVIPVLDNIGPERWPLAFVCSGTVCAQPTGDTTGLASLVKTFGLPPRTDGR